MDQLFFVDSNKSGILLSFLYVYKKRPPMDLINQELSNAMNNIWKKRDFFFEPNISKKDQILILNRAVIKFLIKHFESANNTRKDDGTPILLNKEDVLDHFPNFNKENENDQVNFDDDEFQDESKEKTVDINSIQEYRPLFPEPSNENKNPIMNRPQNQSPIINNITPEASFQEEKFNEKPENEFIQNEKPSTSIKFDRNFQSDNTSNIINKRTFQIRFSENGTEILTVKIPYPTDKEELVNSVINKFNENPNSKLIYSKSNKNDIIATDINGTKKDFQIFFDRTSIDFLTKFNISEKIYSGKEISF